MRNNPVILYCASVLAGFVPLGAVLAQAPAKPVSQEELQRQIESLNPAPAGAARRPAFSTPETRAEARGAATPAARPEREDRGAKPAEATPKKEKGPTEIVALEATFDEKAHLAVFIGEVVVTDPEFILQSDKLTAHLKHSDQPQVPAATGRLQAATPKPVENQKPKSGGLERAIAEADPGKLCTVVKDKKELDGSSSHSIGHGRRVDYDAGTGDITLTGMPDVQQGMNTCVATHESTIMILNRDGHMRVTGPHKTVIRESSDLTK